MEWQELTLDNEDYVYTLEDNGIPVLFAQDYGDDGIGYFDDRWMSIHTMAKQEVSTSMKCQGLKSKKHNFYLQV